MVLAEEVARCAKQVYNHLGLRERISALANEDSGLPPEVQKMQMLSLTGPKALSNVVRQFLQWDPPGHRPKTLNDLVQLLEDNIVALCTLAGDLADPPESLDNIPASTTKRPAPMHVEENATKHARLEGYSVRSSGAPLQAIESPVSPMPPQLTLDDDAFDSPGFNLLCHCTRKTRPFHNAPWTFRFEVARFLTVCRVPRQDVSIEVLYSFFQAAKADPRKLYYTMMNWYHSKNGTGEPGAATYAQMERCSDHVWTRLEQTTNVRNRMIHYSGILTLATGAEPTIHLRPPKVGASNRFFRKFNEDRFLELKLNRSSHPSQIRANANFFLKPFLLIGRTFRLLFIKDDTVILFATEGEDLKPVSIREVIDWHIPIMDNWSMTESKFASRMSLGYSNSIPTLTFEPENVQYIDDIYSGAAGEEETCMTDGCGIISCAAMRKIMGSERIGELPCAVQGRIGGSKGVWILSPDLDFNAGEWIKIRKSQLKFKTGVPQFDLSIDPIHYTFDLVKNAICIYPSNLNTQFIQCLSAGGVPTEIFVDLLKEYLQRITSVVYENHNVRVLRDWVAKAGGVMRARWEMEDTEKGVWREQSVDDDSIEGNASEEGVDYAPSTSSSDAYWKINAYSGNPAGLHESLVRLLDAGFDLSNAHVAAKVTNVFRDAMRSVMTKYKIEVLQSCTVTCVPDPTGTLEEGEIFLHMTSRRVDETTAIRSGPVIGDIVVTRNPCGLKSDVQKVKAVDCPALRIYTDVVVFSVKGKRSLASMLGGGDYDGDIVFCCWDPRIVEPFQASPVEKEPGKAKAAFDKNMTTLARRLAPYRDEAGQEQALQSMFLSITLPDGTLGVYENWRTVLAEHTSLDYPDVAYLAYMCAKLVDAPKQGLALKPAVLRRDRNDFSRLAYPAWFVDKKNKQREKALKSNLEGEALERQTVTTMDHLHATLMKETDAFTNYSRSMFVEDDVVLNDADLSAPWANAMHMARELKDEAFLSDLAQLQRDIDTNFEDYTRDSKEIYHKRQRQRDNRLNPTREVGSQGEYHGSQHNTAFEMEEYVARAYVQVPDTIKSSILIMDRAVSQGQLLQAIKASYAYLRTIQNEKYSKYCYIVAYDTLRRLKADARAKMSKQNGLSESVAPSMYTAMTLDRSWMRRIKESKATDDGGVQGSNGVQVRVVRRPSPAS